MKRYLLFLADCFRLSFVGDWRYHLWMLMLLSLAGVYVYCQQLVYGLVTTGMTDQVSWGLYIANFTYLVGLAAAAAMLVIPVYVYRNLHLHDVVIFGELLAMLEPLRTARLWESGVALPGVTDVRLHRVICAARKDSTCAELRTW